MYFKCFVWGGWGKHECTKSTEVQIKTQIFSLVVMNGVTGGETGHRLGEFGDIDACQDSTVVLRRMFVLDGGRIMVRLVLVCSVHRGTAQENV